MFKKILLSIFVLYSFLGFIVLPYVVKPQIENIVASETNSKLSIEDIYFNPFNFIIEISGISLKTFDCEKIASLDMLAVDLEPHSLFKAALHVKSIILYKPQIFAVYNSDKTFNFSKIIKENSNKDAEVKEPVKLPRVIVGSIRVEDGNLEYEDFTNSSKFELALNPINIKLVNIDTKDFSSSDATLRFYTVLSDGGEIDFRSNIVSLKPLKLEGNFKFDMIKLYTNWKYIQDKIGIEVADGTMFLSAKYSLNIDDLNATKIDEVYFSLNNLRVKPKDEYKDILNLELLHIDNAVIKPMIQYVYIPNIDLYSLTATVKRDKNGDVDWVGYLKNQQEIPEKKQDKKQEGNPVLWNVFAKNITLKKIGVDLKDSSVIPSVHTKLNELNIALNNVTLSGEKPFLYDINFLINDKFACDLRGDVKHKELEINTYIQCKDFDFVHYNPYIDQIASKELKTYNIVLKDAVAYFDVNATLKDENSELYVFVNDSNFSLNNFVLNKKDKNEKLVSFSSLDIKGVNLDTKTKNVAIENIALNALGIYAKRDKNGVMNFEKLIEPKQSPSSSLSSNEKESNKDEEGYRVKVESFDINAAKVSFDDNAIQKSAKTTLDKINLHAKNIDSKENSWLKYDLALKINNQGVVKSSGDIMHTPLKQKGMFEVSKISLKEFNPYLQENTFLKINDGYLSLNGKTVFKQESAKKDAKVDADVKVEKFFLHDSRDNSKIASFLKADLKSFHFKTAPNSLYIDEALLDSFYLDVVIDKNKSMNLAKLVKQKESKNQETEKETTKTKSEDNEKFIFKLSKFRVTNGRADFADYSLPVDFKTSIHDLNGDIYAISNNKGEETKIEIDGAVDTYASTELKGSFDSSNIKSFLDIAFNFKNLNLNSISGYSAQFAGYKIDKGKLFLDLKYQINNSELSSRNNIVIKSIELGDTIKDKNIKKLPLGFAIALLEDKNGVIDIKLPIEGNIDKPDFKYGSLVVKTLANLIVKAVTSPFKFLGEVMGINGEELKNIDFEAGEIIVINSQINKLDNIANILLKKPKLNILIAGSYDKAKDFKAIKSKKLKQEIAKTNKQNQPTIKVLEKIYTQSGRDIKALKDELKKRTKSEMSADEYQKELYAKCLEIQNVTMDELKNLANLRAKYIQNYLVIKKNIEAKKIFLREVKEVSNSQSSVVSIELELGVK
ncbi:MAG: hypothetical protein C0628_01895 [Sulfurimonas sp.]|nr:MAG: hypothetical protein C0628_01895 [Sulfurimonas sp.]